MNAEPPAPDRCPLCGHTGAVSCWLEDPGQFLVECPHCTVFTITAPLAARFRCEFHPDERRLVARLSLYLRGAGDDGDREITADSWIGLAADGQ